MAGMHMFFRTASRRIFRIGRFFVLRRGSLPGCFVSQPAESVCHNCELAVFYFSTIMEGCGGCYAHYASHVLPDTAGRNRQDPKDFFALYQLLGRSIMILFIRMRPNPQKGVKP